MVELGIAKRQQTKFYANPKRVLGRFFFVGSDERTRKIIDRILALPADQTSLNLKHILDLFEYRHRDFKGIMLKNFERVSGLISPAVKLSTEQKLLIGGYFTNEYSIEAAALFNPSLAPHPDQSGVPENELRYVMSLRAAGEGHISSLEFNRGIIQENGDVAPDPISNFATNPESVKVNNGITEICFGPETDISERVIFPVTREEITGIEDVRLVPFKDEHENTTYYGTYTAYDGHKIKSKILETSDFLSFTTRNLTGKVACNKGMALFPRKINGKYAMISRQDGENIFLMYSDDLYNWEHSTLLQEPTLPWEFVQLGNCGSPLETDEGWLLLSHSVGPMRSYYISAYLLNKKDPGKVIGYLPRPLVSPNEFEREGYVPNVVYSCGGLIHNQNLIISCGMSDYACTFVSVNLESLLQKMI